MNQKLQMLGVGLALACAVALGGGTPKAVTAQPMPSSMPTTLPSPNASPGASAEPMPSPSGTGMSVQF